MDSDSTKHQDHEGIEEVEITESDDSPFLSNFHLEYPRFMLIRGEEIRVETLQFTPQSLMTIRVEGTGSTKMTTVQMQDHMGQTRYKSSNGGTIHEYITRLQNTRSYGRWKLTIDGILPDEERTFELQIPFFVVKEIDNSLDEPVYQPEPVLETNEETEEQLEEEIVENPNEIIEDPTSSSLLDEVLKDEIKSTRDRKPALKIKEPLPKTSDQDHSQEEVVSTDPADEDKIKSSHDKQHVDQINEETEDLIQSLDDKYENATQKELNQEADENVISSEPDSENAKLKIDETNYLDEMLKEVGSTKIETIKELFIPLDELGLIENHILNMLNENEIYYIEEFLFEPNHRLAEITQLQENKITQIRERIKLIISDEKDIIFQKYSKHGEIEDNTLYYSTIDVTEINGIGPKTKEKLLNAGIENVTELSTTRIKKLSEITKFSIRKVVEFIVEAQSLAYKRVNLIDFDFQEYYDKIELGDVSERAQLDMIHGIDLEVMNEMYGIGIGNIGKIAEMDPIKLSSMVGRSVFDIISWIFEAQILYKNRVSIQFRYQ